jgi:hypothetical protein
MNLGSDSLDAHSTEGGYCLRQAIPAFTSQS